MNLDVHRPLGSFVAESAVRARVFERFGLDYCCGGRKSLLDACTEKGVNVTEVVHEILKEDRETGKSHCSENGTDWANASLTELTRHIEEQHHQYMRSEMPRLVQLALKVADRHGAARPELKTLADSLSAFAEQITAHMLKEDTVLFPMIRELENSDQLPLFHCGSLSNPVRVMEFEHDEAGEVLMSIRGLTDNFSLPEDACNSYRVLFARLQEVESDMHRHVHKESNILFPRALEMEKLMKESGAV